MDARAGASKQLDDAGASSEPFRSAYATDSASMQGKAIALMKEAARMKEKEASGEKVN